ncbi:MAG: glycosyltransferase [Gemmatimonadota bacterium]|nr:glycosyltransferase [Gemmatimonadota bacterium]
MDSTRSQMVNSDAVTVTIGMPLHNNERTVVRAIEYLQRQTRGDFRLIVSDDGSHDQTARLVEAMARGDERIPHVLLHREITPPERYGEYVRRDARSAIERAMPLLPMTRHVLAMTRVPRTRHVVRALLDLNLGYHVDYMRRYHPWLARAYGTASSRGMVTPDGRG